MFRLRRPFSKSWRSMRYTTSSPFTVPTGPVMLYDFTRFNMLWNEGKHIRWPLDELEVTPYCREDPDENPDEVLQKQLSQPRVPLKDAAYFLPDFSTFSSSFYEQEINHFGKTLHADSLLIGIHNNKENGKLERYILKFFPDTPKTLAGAKREVLLSYLFVESGEADHAPKISLQYLNGVPYVLRRYYRGNDGRSFLKGGQLPEVSNDSLINNYALRYVLFGDLDFHNPGNIIFTRHSQLTPKLIVHIDGEYIFPDPLQTSHYSLSKMKDTNSKHIPGSLGWRQDKSAELGQDAFFEMMMESENPILSFLRFKNTKEELKGITLPYSAIENYLNAWPYYEQLVRSFDIMPLDILERREADFQKILKCWLRHTELLAPITLKQLITGQYHE